MNTIVHTKLCDLTFMPSTEHGTLQLLPPPHFDPTHPWNFTFLSFIKVQLFTNPSQDCRAWIHHLQNQRNLPRIKQCCILYWEKRLKEKCFVDFTLFYKLTYFKPLFLFYTPWKHQNVSVSIERQHWSMSLKKLKLKE